MCFWWREKNEEVLMCFSVFGREQKFRKMCYFLVWRVLGAIYSPGTHFKTMTLQGPPASKGIKWGWSWHPWKYLGFLFLKRYGSWNSNSRIKSYGFRKSAVHRSVYHPGFRDTSIILTLILNHEQSLEWEFYNLRNDVGFNLFWQSNQN